MPLNKNIKKVIFIGSGPIVIGQAAEFDYAGTQACRVLKNEGIEVVLVNSNPATIMTDSALADHIYLEPLTAQTVKRVIEKEHPDSILGGLGGQTGLTISMQLAKEGYLEKNNVRLIGTNAKAIDKAEDRQLFRQTMVEIGQPVVPSDIANDVESALKVADEIGYPIIIRPAFTLGGAGGGVAYNKDELIRVARRGLMLSPITQVLVEKYIAGWKEIEFEVMRDSAANVIAVCSMENVDPVGIHTGDSIVIAPTVTLSDKEYQMLRTASLDIISALEIEGGCNVQLALNPNTFEYSVIEVNPRVSRSSALASKATGYPIAKVTTKIALGYTLDEIRNDVTGKTCACFEPTLDYVVVKMPRWPFDKFINASRTLGTQMKATGEVMSIAPYFEAALMKAVRGSEIGLSNLNYSEYTDKSTDELRTILHNMDDMRIFAVFCALKKGISVDEIHEITMIDKWFLYKIKHLAEYELEISNCTLTEEQYVLGKKLGYTDADLQKISGHELNYHRDAVYKMVDTCAAEFSAETPYFYSTYDDICESREISREEKERIIVIGSGPIRIGQGIEFDYSSVHCVWALKDLGYEVILINNNPETVSTDFDTGDRLYFEPLTPEDVLNIIKVEKPCGVVVAFGGQTAIKLTKFLDKNNIPILGTSAESIDIAEDRDRFDKLLENYSIRRPKGTSVMTMDEALAGANNLGYPVLLRPSYVIGGQNMTIAYTDDDVKQYMAIILSYGIENPVLIDKYMMGTELEVDCISDGEDVLIPGIMEHIERAGVHSGDSIAVYPPYNLQDKMLEKICDMSEKLAIELKTKGLINIQYLIFNNELYVIEVNPRASRTIPYISKVTGVPMVDLASKIMVGAKLKDLGYKSGLYKTPPYFAVKVPVFSFEKLNDVNSQLGPEMKSTGEVLGVGKNLNEALFKGLVSAGFKVDFHGKNNYGVLITVTKKDRFEIVTLAKKLDDLHAKIWATPETANAIESLGIEVNRVNKLHEDNSIMDLLETGCLDYIVYTGKSDKKSIADYIKLFNRANQLGIATLTSLDTANALADIIASRYNQSNTELVDINNMRKSKGILKFSKMHGTGDDYIFFDNRCGIITCPESFAIEFSDRHRGIGGDGIVLIENSDIADAKMRIFNIDGSEGKMAGNSIRCVGKFLHDKGIIKKDEISIETASGIRYLKLFTRDGKVSSVTVDMGKAILKASDIPVKTDKESLINSPVVIDGTEYNVTCVSVGNPHCVLFVNNVDKTDIKTIGTKFENAEMFPERVNTEFVRIVNDRTIKMRVWERGNGETPACGTGAVAAVVAAVENGYCPKGVDITVKLRGGDLVVNYTDDKVYLTGDCNLVYRGEIEY